MPPLPTTPDRSTHTHTHARARVHARTHARTHALAHAHTPPHLLFSLFFSFVMVGGVGSSLLCVLFLEEGCLNCIVNQLPFNHFFRRERGYLTRDHFSNFLLPRKQCVRVCLCGCGCGCGWVGVYARARVCVSVSVCGGVGVCIEVRLREI